MKSNEVFVFPCTNRKETYDLAAKILSEQNITNMIKSVTDNHSYVINDNVNALEFVVDGYYFKLNSYPGDNVYVKVNTEGGTLRGDSDSTDESVFDGLLISDTYINGYFPLVVDRKIPEMSKLKFNRASLGLTSIDCGELN